MNISKKIDDNIKFENLFSNKCKLFIGTPIINCNISISIIDNNKKIHIDDITIIDFYEKYNHDSLNNKKSFYIYKNGFNFLNDNDNKLIYLSPTKVKLCNIYTTLISCKIINNDAYIIDDIIKITYEKLLKKFFTYDIDKIINFIHNDYNNYFVINNIFDNLNNHYLNCDNDELYDIAYRLLKLDVKINLLILFIIKYNKNITDNDIFNLYDFIYDNIEHINSSNLIFINNNELLNKIKLNISILLHWFIYIDLCDNYIYLINICNNLDNFTDEQFNNEIINKKYILDKYFNYDECINKLTNFKIIFK